MHNATSPPMPNHPTPTFSSLIETITPWSDGHPYAALMPLLRRLHSTLEVLRDYALHHSGADDDPIYTRIVDVIESAASMANCCCEHAGDLEKKIVADLHQLKAIAAQYGEEGVSMAELNTPTTPSCRQHVQLVPSESLQEGRQ
mgnify:CR=1 FL=1